MENLDDAALSAMLSDPDLRSLATEIMTQAIRHMKYELKYGTPEQRSAIYRSVTSALLRQSVQRQEDGGIESLRAELESMRAELRGGKPTVVAKSIIRADVDHSPTGGGGEAPHVRKPPPVPAQPHRVTTRDR